MKCPKCHFDNPEDTYFCGKCGTQLPPSEEIPVSKTKTLRTPIRELTRGSTFAKRYEVIEELGKGGMGKVYRVFDKKIEEEVALKLLKPEIAADEDTIKRFRNELKFARKIVHKNVCRMFDLGEEKGAHYITMEYVSGEDLKSTIRRMGALTVGKAIFIAQQVCKGLAEAHHLGVVHRDLKPQNIMIDREGNARIMDFGIARSLEAKGITDAGVMIGTPEYMSAEQVEGKEVDGRSDIYSLGVILYEMVTGRVPFEGDTPLSIALKHKTEAAPDPREVNAQIPEDLSSLILKCMEKDKGKRYQGAEEVLSELSNIEKGIPTTERVVPKRKPITTKEITVTFSMKKLLIPALVVIVMAIFFIIIWKVIPRKEAVPIAPPGKPSLAVMYFENNTGDESLDHWRKALSDLLITDLSQSKYLRILSGENLFNILSQLNQLEAKSYSSEVLKDVAARGRVENILVGKYAKAGDAFRIDIVLQEASTGELIGSQRVEGVGEESMFSMVDELTRRIKENYDLSAEEIASDIDKEVGKITTSSPEAYKYYSEGRMYHNQGDYRQSIPFMEKALAIDPEFAMAYRSMAMSYSNLGYSSKYREYIQKAFELSERVSDRERYTIQAEFYRMSQKTWDKAIEAYNKLLQLYPNDDIGNNNLGLLYSDLEQWDKAIERFEVLIQNKDETYYAYTNISSAYAAKGLYDNAREVLEYYLNNFSDNAIIHWYLSGNFISQGKYDFALVEVDKSISLAPAIYYNFILKGDIYHCRGDLIPAEEEYQKLLETEEQVAHLYGRDRLGALYLLQGRFEKSKDQAKQGIELAEKLSEMEWKSDFHLQLAYRCLKSGNPEEALKECEKGWSSAVEAESIGEQRRALHYKGLTYLEMNSMDEAQTTADELKELIQKGMNRKIMRLYHHLMGMIELKRENFAQAIEYFKKAISLLPSQHYPDYDNHVFFIDSLALAYYQVGDIEKAAEEYERIISLTTGRLYYGDIYAKSFYMLGIIYQEKGWEGKAIEHYDKFLHLWKEADLGIPELIDAKKRLTALQSQ